MSSDAAFDAALEAYQEQEREAAEERAFQADYEASRPNALREEVTFADLVEGDFMTNEEGPFSRWVKVVKVQPNHRLYDGQSSDGWVTVTFQTPQPLGVGYQNQFLIERESGTPVAIDAKVRAAALMSAPQQTQMKPAAPAIIGSGPASNFD